MTRPSCFLMMMAAIATTVTLPAGELEKGVKWEGLCSQATSGALTIKTTTGTSVTGTCFMQTEHGITLNVNGSQRTVARDDIASVRLDNRSRTHCLANVGTTAASSLIMGFYTLPSRYFFLTPMFLAGAPTILVGGPPFCAIYDLVNRLTGSHKITII